jgi:hypothetical protein
MNRQEAEEGPRPGYDMESLIAGVKAEADADASGSGEEPYNARVGDMGV